MSTATPDPFEHLDAAYAFGALDAAETAQFEAHLSTCPACTARVAAACLALVAVLAWPTSVSHGATYSLVALRPSPVSATVELAQTPSGTSIKLHCVYRGNGGVGAVQYGLVVYDHANHAYPLSTWTLSPGEDQVFPATTALAESQIGRLSVTYQNQPILTVTP